MRHVDLFSTWIPLLAIGSTSLSKAGVSRPPPQGSPAYINAAANGGNTSPLLGAVGGIVSCQARDQQGEVIMQDGIDWDYFLSKGHLNYEHQPGPDNVIGYPECIEKTTFNGEPATRFRGYLYLHDPRAARSYETAKVMQKSGGARSLGFSVEGAVLQRDQTDRKTIRRSQVLDVALTSRPVHPDARLEVLARSLFGAQTLNKSGEIGYQTPGGVAGGISTLVPQSLESRLSSSTYGNSEPNKQVTFNALVAKIRKVFPNVDLKYAQDLAHSLFQRAH